MGKTDEDRSLAAGGEPSDGAAGGGTGGPCPRCRPIGKIVRLRCVAALFLGVAVLLSAIFWIPPFIRRAGSSRDLSPDPESVDIVASFRLQKPVPVLSANIAKLEVDILEEIGVPNSLVVVISLEPLAGSNWTNVVFGVWPYTKNSTISSAGLSLLRASFMSLVVEQSTLHLTTSLFGNASFFQVLKFPGGITIIPPQSVFLLQKVHMLFNFTLNFPIYQLQHEFEDLKDQLYSGLHLNSYENLYVRLTNVKGSTIAPPTVIQSSVVLAVGNDQPSLPRLKQLAQTISSSSAGNLGLNHTVFGRVKQIHLSSFLQRSLDGGGTSPSPAPQPHSDHHHHHHRHHHHHPHKSGNHLAPAPAPQSSYYSPPPTGCNSGSSRKSKGKNRLVSAAAPVPSQDHSSAHLVPAAPPMQSDHHGPTHSFLAAVPVSSQHHSRTPHIHEDPAAPAPVLLPLSPLPAVSYSHAPSPSDSLMESKPPGGTPSISPSPFSSCCVGGHPSIHWAVVPLVYLFMRL